MADYSSPYTPTLKKLFKCTNCGGKKYYSDWDTHFEFLKMSFKKPTCFECFYKWIEKTFCTMEFVKKEKV